MVAEQTDLQQTFPIRKQSTGDNSEYYGIPLWTGRGYAEKQYTGQSQPTSPSSKNSKHNYETSRSVPRSYKRHESRQPPDAGKGRDEGEMVSIEQTVLINELQVRVRFHLLSALGTFPQYLSCQKKMQMQK